MGVHLAKRKRKTTRRQSQGVRKPAAKKIAPTRNKKPLAAKKIPKKALKKSHSKPRQIKKAPRKKIVIPKPPKKARLRKPQKHQTRSIKKAVKFIKGLLGRDKRGRFIKIQKRKKPRKQNRATKKKLTPKKKTRVQKIKPKVTVQKLKSGEIKTISFDIPFQNLDQWLSDLQDNPTLDGLIPEGAQLGFRFYGNNSLRTFSSVKEAALTFSAYNTTQDALTVKPENQNEVYRNIEFVIVSADEANQFSSYRNEEIRKHHREKRRRRKKSSAYKKTYWSRVKERQPKVYRRQLDRKREKARERYERLKNDPGFKQRARLSSRRYYARIKRK